MPEGEIVRGIDGHPAVISPTSTAAGLMAAARDQKVGPGASLRTREDKENVMFEARDEKSKAVVHRSYVKKH